MKGDGLRRYNNPPEPDDDFLFCPAFGEAWQSPLLTTAVASAATTTTTTVPLYHGHLLSILNSIIVAQLCNYLFFPVFLREIINILEYFFGVRVLRPPVTLPHMVLGLLVPLPCLPSPPPYG